MKIICLLLTFFVFSLLLSTEPIILHVPPEKHTLAISMADSMNPYNRNVINRIDVASWTIRHHITQDIDSKHTLALNQLLINQNINLEVFYRVLAEFSRQHNSKLPPNQVVITCDDQHVSTGMIKLVRDCAQEMNFFDHIMVKAGAQRGSADGGISGNTVKSASDFTLELFLNIEKTAQLPRAQLVFYVKHEIAHFQKKHGLIGCLLNTMLVKKDAHYFNLARCNEMQADICALLTDKQLIPVAKNYFNNQFWQLNGRTPAFNIVTCQKSQSSDGVIYNILVEVGNKAKKWITLPYIVSENESHPESLERIAYVDELEQEWNRWLAYLSGSLAH